MMDITVYWKHGSDHSGKVEKHSTPIITTEDTWDCLRVGVFGPDENGEGTGIWTLGVEAYHPAETDDGGNVTSEAEWRYTHTVIKREAGGEEGFFAYLERNVSAVHVDGYPWWIGPEEE